MGVPWILLTASHSARPLIYEYSEGLGGRQQPGQPELNQALSEVLCIAAHCVQKVDEREWRSLGRERRHLAIAATVEERELCGAKVNDIEPGMVLTVSAEAEGLVWTAGEYTEDSGDISIV
jgi:hypothetical protein